MVTVIYYLDISNAATAMKFQERRGEVSAHTLIGNRSVIYASLSF